jgi:hypothetical protein
MSAITLGTFYPVSKSKAVTSQSEGMSVGRYTRIFPFTTLRRRERPYSGKYDIRYIELKLFFFILCEMTNLA